MVSELLVVRAEDLVVLALECDACEISGQMLTAASDGATISVTFPPQAISETKTDNVDTEDAYLSRPSIVVMHLKAGEQVELTVVGLLAALTTHPLDTATTVIELPYGLQMTPRHPDGTGVTSSGPTRPAFTDDHSITGLWELVLAEATPTMPAVVGSSLFARQDVDDLNMDVAPLNNDERATIGASSVTPTIERLRLSALGGSLTSSVSEPFLTWKHRTTLGRDAKVLFIQSGILWPFGHHASIIQTAERQIDLVGRAILHRETTLRVSQPVVTYPDSGDEAWRSFPFHDVEILGGPLSGVALHTEETWVQPQDLTDAVQQKINADTDALYAAAQSWAPAQPIPTNFQDFLQSQTYADTDAASYGEAVQNLSDLQAGVQSVIDNEYVDPDTGQPWESSEDAAAIKRYTDQKPQWESQRDTAYGHIQQTLAWLVQLVPNYQEQDDPVLWARRIATLGDQGAQYVIGLADALDALKLSANPAQPPTVSTIRDGSEGGSEHLFHVRLGGRLGDVPLTMPLVFIHDLEVPAQTIGDYEFPGYSSLDDSGVPQGRQTGVLPVPGVPVDLVRRTPSRTVDVQEVHSLQLRATRWPRQLQPVLVDFEITIPELRTLLPDQTDVHRAVLSGALLNSGDASIPIELSPPVSVDFSAHAERSGGLLTPSFDADRISEAHGPANSQTLVDQGEAALAALGRMKLFGVGLNTLLKGFQGAPAILQELEDGVPRGVTMDWSNQILQDVGPFVAHGKEDSTAPTTMTLHVEQTPDSNTTMCSLTGFSLVLPSPAVAVVSAYLESLAFVVSPGHEPTLKVGKFELEFGDVLNLVKDLADQADLGGAGPHIKVDDAGIAASYAIAIPNASSGIFLLSNISFEVDLTVPFRSGGPSVQFAFAKPEAPFALRVPPFGGTGYLDLTVDAGGLEKVAGSLEFGGSVGVDFAIVKAEAHVMVGVRVEYDGTVTIAGFVHIGGSVKLLGLVTVSVDLRVELAYDGRSNQLSGRATLVIAVDLTLYATSVELDSGLWVFAGGSQTPPPEVGAGAAQPGWDQHQGAYSS